MNFRNKNFLIYTIIIIFFSSCAVTKIIKIHKTKNLTVEKIYSNVKDNQVNYNTYSIKYSAKIDLDGKNYKVSGNLRIKKDSAIWISMTAGFGVEIVRVLLTKDTVRMINRLNSTYFVGDYNYLNNLLHFNFNFNTIQSVLTNTFFCYNSKLSDKSLKQFEVTTSENSYFLYTFVKDSKQDSINKHYVMQQFLIMPDSYKIIKAGLIDNLYKRNLQIGFSDFININKNQLPQKFNFIFTKGTKKSVIDLNYNKITVNNPLRMPFHISNKYKAFK